LPERFNFDLASVSASAKETNLPLGDWADLGLKRANGGALPQADINASLIVPEGAEGTAFLVYENYNVILDWNRSVFYAIAVGHLADRLVGARPLFASPRTEAPLTREDAIMLQTILIELGYLSGEADGILGSKSRRAVKAFQGAKGMIADGYADRALVSKVSKSRLK
jgi:membrane-bound lytic murein transglycosylase B